MIGGTSASTTHAAFFLYVNGDTRLSRLRVGTGSNGEPGIHFEGDSDTGIRRSDADKLGFITGGSERLSIGSAGEVLVGGSAAGTSGQVLTSGGSGAAVSWAAGGGGTYEQFGDMSSIHADRKYIYPNTLPPFSMHQTSFSSQTISDDIIFSPVLFLNDITVSEIGVHVASASGPFEVALYSSNANLLPATRMHTAASFSAPGAGNIFTASIPGGNITLSANTRYYIGVTNTTNGTNTSVRTVGSAGTTMKIGSDINRCAIAIFLGTNNSLPATIPQDTNLAELYRAPMVILVEA